MKSILFIDDHEDLSRLMAKRIGYFGYNTYSETNPVEGLRLALDIRPDLVITDVMMPEMDGLDLAGRLYDEHIPVMLLTAYEPKEKELQKCHALECLMKPIDVDELLDKIKTHIGG